MTDSPLNLPSFTLGRPASAGPSSSHGRWWGALGLGPSCSPDALRPARQGSGRAELVVGTIDDQIRAIMRLDPRRYLPLVGTLFVFILAANWASVIPGYSRRPHIWRPTLRWRDRVPATIWFGVRVRGTWGYLKSFAGPSCVMVPLNLIEQITRTFSLMVRLFGNVISGVFVIGIILSLAGLWCGSRSWRSIC